MLEKPHMKSLIKLFVVILLVTGLVNIIYPNDTFSSNEINSYSHSFDHVNLATDSDANFVDNSIILAKTIDWFSDCDDEISNSSCGGLPARWFPDDALVEVCTRQLNRPIALSEKEFNSSVVKATNMWNSTNAAVGLKYVGNCEFGVSAFFGNNTNEIAFDDYRNVVRGTQAAITRGRWQKIYNNETSETDKRFLETDIVIDEKMNYSLTCFDSLVAHELGHVLGFGHSSNRNDLMYPTFNTSDISTCKTEASEIEKKQLPELYGYNNAPTINSVDVPKMYLGSSVVINAFAVDPDNDQLDFSWEQKRGSKLSFVNDNSQISFQIPQNAEGPFEFVVTVKDNFGKADAERIMFDVEEKLIMPIGTPSFIAFNSKKVVDRYESNFTWSSIKHATEYRFCDYDFSTKSYSNCFERDAPEMTVNWKKDISSLGSLNEINQFNVNTREIGLSGCNDVGCSDFGLGPHIGGIEWKRWGIEFDFLAMSYDIPNTHLQFSIGGVVNLEYKTRSFEIWSGTVSEPLKEKILSCGLLAPGDSCIGLLMPEHAGHYSHISIVSKSFNSPTTLNQVKIR